MHWTLEELIGAFRCSFVPVQVLVVDDDVTSRAAARALEQHGCPCSSERRERRGCWTIHTGRSLADRSPRAGCGGIELANAP
jgi:hypothetical protein